MLGTQLTSNAHVNMTGQLLILFHHLLDEERRLLTRNQWCHRLLGEVHRLLPSQKNL